MGNENPIDKVHFYSKENKIIESKKKKVRTRRQKQNKNTSFINTNSGFLYSAQVRHAVTLMALQHYYPGHWALRKSLIKLITAWPNKQFGSHQAYFDWINKILLMLICRGFMARIDKDQVDQLSVNFIACNCCADLSRTWPVVYCHDRTCLLQLWYLVLHTSTCNCSRDIWSLKALDTFGNCQRPVLSLVPTHRHNMFYLHVITNLWKLFLNWSSKLQENNERKNTLVAQIVCFQTCQIQNKRLQAWKSFTIWEINNLFRKNYRYMYSVRYFSGSRCPYYQQLSIARYQDCFYANLPIVSTAFNNKV